VQCAVYTPSPPPPDPTRSLRRLPPLLLLLLQAMQELLVGQTFDVLLLDECSQMTEPTSLMPLLRARARHLIAAGDPCQLPPVIASPAVVGSHQQHQQQHQQQHGLLRPLFVRLSALGHAVHLLDTQYRLHPALSAIPSAHFYQGRLKDGVTGAQRPPLLPGLPPLMFCDVQGGSGAARGGGGGRGCLVARRRLKHSSLGCTTATGLGAAGACVHVGAGRLKHTSRLIRGRRGLLPAAAAGGQVRYDASRSSSNQREAGLVAGLVRLLLEAGVPAGDMGVICFFR